MTADDVFDPLGAGLVQEVNGVRLCASCAEPIDGDSGVDPLQHWRDRHGLQEIDVESAPESPPPIEEGLAVAVETGQMGRTVMLLACTECGVLLWDVEAHWTDAHAHRLQALRAIASRG